MERGSNAYPNPTSGKIYLAVNSNEKIKNVEVVEASGKTINLPYLNIDAGQIQIDVSMLSNGTYVARVITNAGTKTYQFVVIK